MEGNCVLCITCNQYLIDMICDNRLRRTE